MRTAAIVLITAGCSYTGREPASVDAGPPITLVLQQGGDGYTATADTYIRSNMPGTSYGSEPTLILDDDTNPPTAGMELRHGLVRFDELYGPGVRQVPPGATIVSATLALRVVQETETPGTVHEVAVDWNEATTWDTFGAAPGVQPDDLGVQLGPGPMIGTYTLDVTAGITAWAAQPALARGWILVAGGNDGCDVASSEEDTAARRPMLTVVYAR